MSAAGFAVLAIAVLIGYEALKHFGVIGGTATASAAPATSPDLSAGGTQAASSSGGPIPASWLQALAMHESPSILQGNFNYGAFGLQCGAGQGVTSQCTGNIPGGAGDVASYDLYSSWDHAVQGLQAWINRNAPQAYQATSCRAFMAALQQGHYGGTASWPSSVCGLVGQ